MKRFLSWVVLIACTAVVYFVQTIAYRIAMYIIQWFLNTSAFMRIVAIVFGGGTILALASLPIIYGSTLSVIASDAVFPSRRGLRYIIWGTAYLMICLASAVLLYVFNKSLNVTAIAGALYAIALIVIGNKNKELE